jgi:S-adenosylmethionine:tRNA ribosyltransferase-isomerase
MLDVAGWRLPPELRASQPPEQRGARRDQVRLMVINRAVGSIVHTRFDRIGHFLEAGDLLVVNSSRTLPAAIPARRQDGSPVQLRPSVRRGRQWDALAVQPIPPHANVPLAAGERLALAGTKATVEGRRADIPLLWRIRLDEDGLDRLLSAGEPIRYSYVPRPIPLDYYQTVYATHPGSAEAPSAGLAFTWELLLALEARGIGITGIVLHTGLSSFQDDAFDAEHHMYEEWFEVSTQAAAAVARAQRVIAVGTTVVRALETAVDRHRHVRAVAGWTDLKISPTHQPRVVDALLTGFHEPQASHFELLQAFADRDLLARAYAEAIDRRYLWHEFGDTMLIL